MYVQEGPSSLRDKGAHKVISMLAASFGPEFVKVVSSKHFAKSAEESRSKSV